MASNETLGQTENLITLLPFPPDGVASEVYRTAKRSLRELLIAQELKLLRERARPKNFISPRRAIMVVVPTHFSSEALKFLRGLARNNNREWFGPLSNARSKSPGLPELWDLFVSSLLPEFPRLLLLLSRAAPDTHFAVRKNPGGTFRQYLPQVFQTVNACVL
jgi:hypothetical protein